jgi:hypothetical protein
MAAIINSDFENGTKDELHLKGDDPDNAAHENWA